MHSCARVLAHHKEQKLPYRPICSELFCFMLLQVGPSGLCLLTRYKSHGRAVQGVQPIAANNRNMTTLSRLLQVKVSDLYLLRRLCKKSTPSQSKIMKIITHSFLPKYFVRFCSMLLQAGPSGLCLLTRCTKRWQSCAKDLAHHSTRPRQWSPTPSHLYIIHHSFPGFCRQDLQACVF